MPSLAHNYGKWLRRKWRTSYRLNTLRTALYGLTCRKGASQLTLVLGCQRSGTTMLAGAIGLSPGVKNYGEGDLKYFRWQDAPRLAPLDAVEAQLRQERHPYTLLKPLCESQRVAEICERFPTAQALWIVRNYRDCVTSHVNYYRNFHDGLEYVREMLKVDVPCWKNENLPPAVVEQLRTVAGRPLNLPTAYALYWYARNSLAEHLRPNLPVAVVYYEDVLIRPQEALQEAFRHVGVPFRPSYALAIQPPSATAETPRPSDIDPEVERWCDELQHRLYGGPAAAVHASVAELGRRENR